MPQYSTLPMSFPEETPPRLCLICNDPILHHLGEKPYLYRARMTCGKKACECELGAQKRRRRITKVCEGCGKAYERRPCEDKRDAARFCSSACYWASLEQFQTCEMCKKPFHANNRRRFCGRACAGLHRQRRIEFTCPVCDRTRIDPICKLKTRKQMYCSLTCAGIDRVRQLNESWKETSIETETYQALRDLGIHFLPQCKIGPWLADAFVPSMNLIIEVLGDYFHTNPKIYGTDALLSAPQLRNQPRDRRKFDYYHARGYRVIKLWESDIHEFGALCLLKQTIS